MKDHLSRGLVPRPTPASALLATKFKAVTFSIEPRMLYLLEQRMLAQRDRNRSETLRKILAAALDVA